MHKVCSTAGTLHKPVAPSSVPSSELALSWPLAEAVDTVGVAVSTLGVVSTRGLLDKLRLDLATLDSAPEAGALDKTLASALASAAADVELDTAVQIHTLVSIVNFFFFKITSYVISICFMKYL